MISLGLVASNYANGAITRTILSSLQDKSQYINNTLDNYINEIKNTLFVYSYNLGLTDFLTSDPKNETERFIAFKNFNNSAQAIVAPKKYCKLFVIIPEKNYIFSTDKKSTMNTHTSEYIKEFISLFGEENIIGSLITEKFVPPVVLSDKISFSVIQELPYVSSNPIIDDSKCYIIMTSSEQYFKDMFENIENNGTSEFVLITNDQFEIIYSGIDFSKDEIPDIQNQLRKLNSISEPVFTISFKNEPYIGYVNQSKDTNWRVYFFCNRNVVQNVTFRIRMAIMIITICIYLLMLIASYFISRNITMPLRKLKSAMKTVEKGNFNITADINNNDETGELAKSFNQMISHINSLINEVYVSRIFQKEAELYALQQQINPHFLYNTLGAIKSLANMERYSDIRFAVQKLTDIFRYSISGNQSDLATIKDELHHVNSYIAIQKLRFPDKINFTVDIEESILDIRVPRLIMQPIVENCIEHTIAKQPCSHVDITVTGKIESPSTITLSIHNTGPGIPPERLDEIRQSLKSVSQGIDSIRTTHASIGLFNVNARLKLMYKEEYGLQIFSDERGTSVILRLPK